MVPSDGGPVRTLSHEFASARYAVWSPKGDKILFLGERKADSLDWYVLSADGGTVTRTGALEVLQRAGLVGTPIPGGWTNDGRVVFTTTDDISSNVWQLPVSPHTGQVVGDPQRLTFGSALERSAATSLALAGRIVFTSLAENVDVWRVPLDATTGLARGALERVTDNASRDVVMNVSGDDRTLAFVSDRGGRCSQRRR